MQFLRDKGIEDRDIAVVAEESIRLYDIRGKAKGRSNGPIGHIGRDIYRRFLLVDDYEMSIDAFLVYQTLSIAEIADLVVYSGNAAAAAINRLIACGFIERRRIGRRFEFILLLPKEALLDCCKFRLNEKAVSGTEDEYMRPIYTKVCEAIDKD